MDDNSTTKNISSQSPQKSVANVSDDLTADNATSSGEVKHLFERFEGFALKNARAGIDINALGPEQFNLMMQLLHKNEDNALIYHTTKLNTIKDIALGNQKTTTSSQKTKRIIVVSILASLLIVTVLILFFKDNYILNWFSFLGGLIGGAGGIKVLSENSGQNQETKITEDDSDS